MKIATVVGARPQFIKTAVVSHALRAAGLHEVLIHTGQHYDPLLSDIFFTELGIPAPDHMLHVGSGSHGAQTGRMLEGLERVFLEERPDWVLVYGDTNSTLAGALAAAKLHIPVAHVEAGIRSGNRRMPEELNRIATDHLADRLFTPTALATDNLAREGIPPTRVCQVGDVTYDATLYFAARGAEREDMLPRLGLAPGDYALATVHRPENTDDPAVLCAIFAALDALAETLPVVLPLHPRTRAALATALVPIESFSHLRILEPLGFMDILRLEQTARLLLTDSGGMQKEAFYFRVPCVTLRPDTEYPELVEAGYLALCVPRTPDELRAAIDGVLAGYPRNSTWAPFGRGDAAKRVAEILAEEDGAC
jgi:UDP-GlcNAc3NAcA epimerase